MRFCANCENMYYIQISENDENSLQYYCRKCGHTDNEFKVDNVSISKVQLKEDERQFNNIINKYTKLDPTLPRTNRVLCANSVCLTNTDPESNPKEIICIRYDDTNMKYMYLCSTCDHSWKI
jgi:DNA-directed RNA polymerase subunit M/transcription elongation factor TFIIS